MVLTQERKSLRGRPKTIDPKLTLEIAIEAYWLKGIDQMSINEICRIANVSKLSVYREFGNEVVLLCAALEKYQMQTLDNFREFFFSMATLLIGQ